MPLLLILCFFVFASLCIFAPFIELESFAVSCNGFVQFGAELSSFESIIGDFWNLIL